MSTFVYHKPELRYPRTAPFHPDKRYPEFGNATGEIDPGNSVFAAVRTLFLRAGLDAGRAETADWNPFGELVSNQSAVVVKPNLVIDNAEKDYDPLVTHPSIVRALLDYIFLAAPRATVTVCDCPVQTADFDHIIQATGLAKVVAYWKERGATIELRDLRMHRSMQDTNGFLRKTIEVDGDPLGYSVIDLRDASALSYVTTSESKFAVGQYDASQTNKHHGHGRHSYIIANTILNADVLFNVPKLKTHQKAGITCALKNLVGIIGSKDCLPHFRVGSPNEGGDQYAVSSIYNNVSGMYRQRYFSRFPHLWKVARRLARAYKRASRRKADAFITNGAWDGNDTVWRMTYDLNRIGHFAGMDGKLHSNRQRRLINLVDGIVCGSGDGPLRPDAEHCGFLFFGEDSYAIDYAAAILIGADPKRIRLLSGFREVVDDLQLPYEPDPTKIVVGLDGDEIPLLQLEARYAFNPPPGWNFSQSTSALEHRSLS